MLVRWTVPRLDAVFRLAPIRTASTVMYLYGERGGGVLSSGLASRALFAILPGLLLLVAFVGFVIRDAATKAQLFDLLSRLAPPIRDLLGQSLQVIADGAAQVTIVGLVVLIWAAAGFFQTLDEVFAVVLDERHRRGALIRALLGVSGTLVVLAALGSAAILGVLTWSFAEQFLASVDPLLTRLLVPVVVTAIVAGGVGVAYRFIPTRRPPWDAIALPAVAVGIAVSLLTQLFTVIAPHLAGIASLYGAIAAVFVLLAWLQLGAQVVVIGMVWVGIRAFGAPPASSLPWPSGNVGRPAMPEDEGPRGSAT